LIAGFLLLMAGPLTLGCAALPFHGNQSQLRAQAGQLTRQARTALSKGSSQLAKRLLNRSLECCPDDPQAMALLAEASLESGDTDQAITTLMNVAAKAPERTDIQVRLGQAWLAVGQTAQAGVQAEKAIGIDAQYGAAWQLAGDVALAENNLDEALTNFHRAEACPDSDSTLQLQIARVYQQQGRASRALSAVERYQSQFRAEAPCHNGLMLEGDILLALGQNGRAVERLTLATNQPTASAESFVRLSRAQMMDNRSIQARQTLELARQRWPDEPLFTELLAGLKTASPGGNVVIR
jgi:tetratricopeptide (TPR) repeat protein